MPPPPRAQTLRSILGAARSREEAGELLVSERASKDLESKVFPVFGRY